MPKGDRHMTTEEKNLIFKLARKEKLGARDISKTTNIKRSTVQDFLSRSKDIVLFRTCPNCGKEIAVKAKRGRPARFCSSKCKKAYYKKHSSLKVDIRICEGCGKKYKQFRYLKTRFCSRQCASKHIHGFKRL